MRATLTSRRILPLTLALLAMGASARAGIIGVLEAPAGAASQISNVQGWVYTNTPGAELIQPFDVLVDGVKVQQVPCCSDRGDVKGDDPDIPVQTGFSGVINWAREALEADGPVDVSVVVRDTMGGERILSQTVDLYPLTVFPFARSFRFLEKDVPGGGSTLEARCVLSNVAGSDDLDVARMSCTSLVATNPDGSFVHNCSGWIDFTWDRGAQGFRQSARCTARELWTEHGDGTATDERTGLMWELKAGDAGAEVSCESAGDAPTCGDPHHVNNRYRWSADAAGLRDGSAFTLFLDRLNGSVSDDGVTSQGCLAGHCDWRLPTIAELRTMTDPCDEEPCGSFPGETAPAFHWTSTATEAFGSSRAWDVDFVGGGTSQPFKTSFEAARAVRGPLP